MNDSEPPPVGFTVMNHQHYIVKCKRCTKVYTQCRCMSKNKTMRWIDPADCLHCRKNVKYVLSA